MTSPTINWNEIHPSRKWTILSMQKRFAWWALYTCIGTMMMGFDLGIASTATAIPAFQIAMGVPNPTQPSGYLIPARIQSGWAGVVTAGDIVGVLASGQLMNFIGRKRCLLLDSVFAAAGVGMQVASSEWKLFMGGRLVNAIGFGMAFVISPVWISENVRPELRGVFLCTTNLTLVVGQFLLSLVAYGFQRLEGKWSYQGIIVFQFLVVALLLIAYPSFPESPYYLLTKDQPIKARKALEQIHGRGDQALIDAEMARISGSMRSSAALATAAGASGHPMVQCFKGTNLKRTIISILPAAGQQLIGAAFVFGYITYFMSLIGIKDFFTVTCILYVFMLLSNVLALFMVETIGRRPILLVGMCILTVIELIMGIMGCINNAASLWVVLVCIFMWAIVYQISVGAVGHALGAEVSTLLLRPTTMSLVGLTNAVFAWIISFTTPYMINPDAGNLGAKIGFVFFGFGLPLCAAFYFLIPETLGFDFKQMDSLFADGVSPRSFKKEKKLRLLQDETQEDGDSRLAADETKPADTSFRELGHCDVK